MRTNIFRNSYEQPENKLTYTFFSLLEHLSVGVAADLLYSSGVPQDDYQQLTTESLYGGAEANPDGSIVLEGSSRTLTIYFENKTWRRCLDVEQIKRHLRVRLSGSSDDRLLVITADGDDRRELDALGDRRIHFTTWHRVAELAEILSRTADGPKDQFLLDQFQEYLETSGEAWRARMPDSKLIAAHEQFLKIAPDESRFLNECQRLMDALREVADAFEEITDATTEKPRWGRVGNECTLRSAPFGQWLFFGVYFDEQDHKVKFKIPYQAEFAIFFDIQPKNRDGLAKQPKLKEAISALRDHGFEFNFPENKCGNAWRVCYWREPMNQHVGADLNELHTIFERQLQFLFTSDFYRIACSDPQ
jgi:hypothetical protein